MRGSSVVGAVVFSLAALSACGSDGDDGDDGAAAPDGAGVYARSCASCHGSDLRGTSSGPSQLSVVYEPGHHSDASYRRAIQDGVAAHHWNFGPMPPVPGLSDAEVDAVIAYIRAVQAREGFEPYPP